MNDWIFHMKIGMGEESDRLIVLPIMISLELSEYRGFHWHDSSMWRDWNLGFLGYFAIFLSNLAHKLQNLTRLNDQDSRLGSCCVQVATPQHSVLNYLCKAHRSTI